MIPLTIETEVQSEGLVQVRVPNALEGRKVKVTVEQVPEPTVSDSSAERVFGRWKGQIRILPGFDDPIEGLEWAYE